jgi:hypothetical protein
METVLNTIQRLVSFKLHYIARYRFIWLQSLDLANEKSAITFLPTAWRVYSTVYEKHGLGLISMQNSNVSLSIRCFSPITV